MWKRVGQTVAANYIMETNLTVPNVISAQGMDFTLDDSLLVANNSGIIKFDVCDIPAARGRKPELIRDGRFKSIFP